jgi:hypothetical protein
VEVVLYGQADSNASGCHKSLMVTMAVPQRLVEDAKTGIVVSCCENDLIKTVDNSLMWQRIIQHVKQTKAIGIALEIWRQ